MLDFEVNALEVSEYLCHKELKHHLHNLVVEGSKNIDLGEEGEAASHIAVDKKVASDDPVPDPVVVGFHKNPAVAAGPVAAEDIVVGILHLLLHLRIVNHQLLQTIVFQPLSQVSSSHWRQKEFIAPKSKILS
jgi:hypothetical protein